MAEMIKRRRSTNRSPAYPGYPLGKCVELLNVFYQAERFAYVGYTQAIESIGYSATSSTGQRTIAALLQFGLIEERGIGVDRNVRISTIGKHVVLGNTGEGVEYRNALREAALAPRIYRQLWDRWEHRIPSDEVLHKHLILELDFNPNSVDTFVEDYRLSLSFAGLLDATPSYDAAPERKMIPEAGTRIGPAPVSSRTMDMPQPVDLSIPLTNGSRATLQIPIPLSESDYDLLRSFINANLEVMKRVIVS